MIIVVDFGGQTAHLIGRRLREFGSIVSIIEPEYAYAQIVKEKPQAIVLSGGPASVYEKNAPTIDPRVFDLGLPMLCICYGQQLAANLLKGEVRSGTKKEFGPATLTLHTPSPLFNSTKEGVIPDEFTVWMSHGDEVVGLPEGFIGVGKTKTIAYAAYENRKKNIYGIQFHPEVVHTQFGGEILKNFMTIAKMKPQTQKVGIDLVDNLIKNINDSIGGENAISALSGGVDSSVASLLVHRAIGDKLTCLYIDSGLMRHNETMLLEKVFKKHMHMNIKIIDAKRIFLTRLEGVKDPEKKRKIIGKTFIEVFEKEAKKYKARFLVQGTIYPDVIESSGSKHADKIKSHHNVGGLPEKMNLTLIEPLRNFYKDEVRTIGKLLELPASIVERQPFPGPGLATRIVGAVTEYKLDILRKADAIVQEEIEKAGLLANLWQVFAVFTGIKTTGVRGDGRAYGETIAVRAVEARDAMSVKWAHLPYAVLDTISVRMVNEIKEINRVVYDITNKPPATIEWE